MDRITDPETLRDDPGVDFREQERVVGDEEFETAMEGAEDQSGLVVVGVENEDGELLLVDSEWVDGWTLPNGPVGVDEDWAIAADRWSEDALGFPVQIGTPELVIRTETRPESGGEGVVGYTVAFGASLVPGMEDSGAMGPGGAVGGGPPPGVGPDDSGAGAPPGGPPGGAGGSGGAPGPSGVDAASNLDWFEHVPDDVAPGHDALVRFFVER
ncbi:NUDIX hydrolase [Halosimplex salinum]|uniref:hypothetical protein n=1 Tax=Halosimplex salinum TaxID=1710538 RepID=UPI000F493A92|nr:hypothetical protein [Halosimplex salinum]